MKRAFLVLALLRLIEVFVFPVLAEEERNRFVAGFESWFYADIAPLGVWMVSLGASFVDHPLASRVGAYLLGVLSFIFIGALCKKSGFRATRNKSIFMLLFGFSWGGLVYGVYGLHLAPLMFFWILAMHEILVAINYSPKRWLTAGLAIGGGLLASPVMLCMVPVAMGGMVQHNKWHTPWPYGSLAIMALFIALGVTGHGAGGVSAFQDLPSMARYLSAGTEYVILDILKANFMFWGLFVVLVALLFVGNVALPANQRPGLDPMPRKIIHLCFWIPFFGQFIGVMVFGIPIVEFSVVTVAGALLLAPAFVHRLGLVLALSTVNFFGLLFFIYF